MIPIKPTGPATATALPARKITTKPAISFSRPVFKPKPVARSSPMDNTFIFGAMKIAITQPTTIYGNTDVKISKSLPATDPANQNKTCSRAASFNTSKPWVNEANSAAIAATARLTVPAVHPSLRAHPIIQTETPATAAPVKDIHQHACTLDILKNVTPTTAAKPAPPLTPRILGEASGFFVNVCMITP